MATSYAYLIWIYIIFLRYINALTAGRVYLQTPPSLNLSQAPNGQITLYVRNNTEQIKNFAGEVIAEVTLRSFCADEVNDCKYFGPTIYAKPGQLMNITLVNLLRGVGRYDKIMGISAQLYKDPDVVNLHTHGLHVSPGVDNIRLTTSPLCPEWLVAANNYTARLLYHYDCVFDESFGFDETIANYSNIQNYPYQIPDEHYPGTHWYHAHVHGSTTFQVQQGLIGALIIEDNDAYKPDMEETILVASFAWLHNTTECMKLTNNFDPSSCHMPANLAFSRPAQSNNYPFNFPIQSACYIYCKMATELVGPASLPYIPVPWAHPSGDNYKANYTQYDLSETKFSAKMDVPDALALQGIDFFFVNGQVRPVKLIWSDRWYHFRIINTFMDYLFWYYPDIMEDICQVYVMGQDGIYFDDGPRDLLDPKSGYVNNTVILQPGARADIAIQCDFNAAENNEEYNATIGGIPIFSTTSEVDLYPHLGFAPTLRYTKVMMWLEIEDGGTIDPAKKSIDTVFTHQPYYNTSYLKSTLNLEQGEFSSLCTTSGFGPDQLTQCNLVLERLRFPPNNNNRSQVAVNNIQFNGELDLMNICVGKDDSNAVHEWTVTTNYHPFHHHTWPFQLQSNVTFGWIARKGDWRDTMGASGTFRMRANYVVNDQLQWDPDPEAPVSLITHCHYVPHEDHGMMAAIQMTQLEPDGTCSVANDYIIPPTTQLSSTSLIDVNTYSSDTTLSRQCHTRHAQTNIEMADVNTNLTILVNIFESCHLNFSFKLSPRTQTIGNAWIGLGFNEKGYNTDDDKCVNEETGYCYNKFPMTGAGFIVGLQATNNGPLSTVAFMEITLNQFWVEEVTGRPRFLTCPGNVYDVDGELRFSCLRYVFDDSNDIHGAHYLFDDDEEVNQEAFIWAYGEGQFKAKKTYHSSRSGCAFNFLRGNNDEFDYDEEESIVHCRHSQNRVDFDLPLIITSEPTTVPTSAPTEGESADKAYCFGILINVAYIVATYLWIY
eukprot:111206_1